MVDGGLGSHAISPCAFVFTYNEMLSNSLIFVDFDVESIPEGEREVQAQMRYEVNRAQTRNALIGGGGAVARR